MRVWVGPLQVHNRYTIGTQQVTLQVTLQVTHSVTSSNKVTQAAGNRSDVPDTK